MKFYNIRSLIAVTSLLIVGGGAFFAGRISVEAPPPCPPCPPPTAFVTLATNGVRVTVGADMFVTRFGAPVRLEGGRAEWTGGWARIDSAGVTIGDGLRFALNQTP